MKLSDFDYNLPKEMIAQEQIKPRTHSKMIVVWKDGRVEHKHFYDIVDFFRKDDVLVINESKVSYAKLVGKKETGGKVEVMIVNEKNDVFKCKVKGRNIKKGIIFLFDSLKAVVEEKIHDDFYIKFLSKDYKKILNQKLKF